MKSKLLVLLVTIIALAVAGLAWAEQVATPAGEADNTCFATFTTGSGATFFSWCVTQEGNIAKLESPAGFEHIRVAVIAEGYAVCSTTTGTVSRYDMADLGSSGWGAPVITEINGPNTLPLIIVRDSLDGQFRLTQSYAQSTASKSVTMTMTLKNLSASPQLNVKLARLADWDVDNTTFPNIFNKTPDSVIATNTHGVVSTALTFGTSHTTAVELFPGSFTGCFPVSLATPTSGIDGVGWVIYNFGNMNGLASKTVKVVYQRI